MDRLEIGLTEVKFAADNEAPMSFSGYGAYFNNTDSYGDVIAPGAFAENLASIKRGQFPWPAMLSQHGGWGVTADDLTPVGVWTDFVEDGKGLLVEGRLADTARGVELYKLMKMQPRPAINGLSIGFITKGFEPRAKPDDPKRKLTKIDLIEVSLVTRPANSRARVASVKSIEDLSTLNDVQDYLREQGMSKSQAIALIARIKSVGPGNPGDEGGSGNPMAELVAAVKRRNQALA